MAGLAHIRGRDMRGTFAGGCSIVMTGATGAINLIVIDGGNRNPNIDGMTGLAHI